VGLGTCLILTPAVASVGHWFFIRRAYATGVATTGGSIGGIIFPLLIQAITPKVGFEWSIRVVAFICLLLLLTGNCLVRARLEAIQPAFTKGEQSQGSVSSAESSVITIVNAVVEPAEKKKSPFDAVKIDINAFRDPRFLLTTVGVFLIEWALFVPLTYITSYSLHYGLPFNFSYQLLAILNAGSVFGRWLPGFIADRIGRFNTLLITVMLCLTTVLGFWLPTSYIPITENSMSIRKAMLVLFSFFYGFGSGSGISLTPVCVGQICSTHQYGSRHGTCKQLKTPLSIIFISAVY
jgi:MFS family permease